jgi:hypothetical protein
MNMQKIPIDGHAVLFEYSEFARYKYSYYFMREAQQTPRSLRGFAQKSYKFANSHRLIGIRFSFIVIRLLAPGSGKLTPINQGLWVCLSLTFTMNMPAPALYLGFPPRVLP